MKKTVPSKKRNKIRVGIIGTGGMAHVHADNFSKNPDCELVAACDIDFQRASDFCCKFKIPHAFGDVKKLLSQVDAVSIVTPDAFHAPVALQCLAAGKHVLCEKPLALNTGEACEMLDAARSAGVIHMVNFSYRNWPCIQATAEAIRHGDIGEIRHVEASYLQCWLPSKIWGDWKTTPAWLWRLSSQHGSKGVLGDVGVHILDYATFPAGPLQEVSCRLKAFPKAPGDQIGEYPLDANDSAVMHVEFANGALGVIHTSRWISGHPNRLFLKISGTQGTIALDSDLSTEAYRECRGEGLDKALWTDVACDPVPTNYQRFITAVRTGKPGEPDFARGAEIQKLLDACFLSDKERRPIPL